MRDLAVAHNVECIEIGEKLGSKALTVWIADGSNFPGQSNLNRVLDWYLESMSEIYARLPDDWRVFLEHKLYEPAFYSTVISDWGTSLMAAQALGPKAHCLVDLGHHAPNVNIEQIVARLIRAGRLAGFHFNDSKYGDDDLDTGSIDPFRLFLVFNELIDASARGAAGFDPAYMIDQSHNVTDPIESLMASAMETQRAYAQALIVDREALAQAQADNDVMLAHRILKAGFVADVSPILAEARLRNGGAIDPIAVYRASNYRKAKAKERPAVASIVVRHRLTEAARGPRPGTVRAAGAQKSARPRATTAPRGSRRMSPYPRRTRRRGGPELSDRLFRGRRRQALDGNRHRFGLTPEAPPSHPDVAEQSDPRIGGAEVRRELPVCLQRLPIGVAPGLECRMEFISLLGPYRQGRAPAQRVDRHPTAPVELEPMAAWNMVEPAMSVFEIGWLEAKRGDHGRDIKITNRVPC